ncbi:AraC-like DNA-binding protein [Parabacteroides sp. PF5-5]|uniref:helix-turn-helix domain-containing protein n=1 Tax=unclassified Parabacteroides TaxID=2649774 RepID=UPI0024758D4E|nr:MULTISPECIES: AraC family transcriptional regulator [unclassified Parabacteroides]MDH6304417.1 AraC-like DNA-binding protein [Parabacteroides sp. PH5-39]MDH6315430.1 AraC-like DNA-binding protein [Parabacteroides sp. PF5-13]MDH6319076.1 AraC-like DNA-binding protein [Parabacteroides sp. PH5-13]MDH6322806.1 AraC-like DNA-binding protein [Parabacteroides sp. PH5-8]MDH6326622.1 AraC-like DNA-binding protein [Parabacteroides sp. PH5-41]
MLFFGGHRPGNGKNEAPLIEYIKYVEGKNIESSPEDGEVVMLLSGAVVLSSELYPSLSLEEGSFVFLPPGSYYRMEFTRDSSLLLFHVGRELSGGGHLPLHELYEDMDKGGVNVNMPTNLAPLKMKLPLQEYARSLVVYLDKGMDYPEVFDLKMEEFFLLLRLYYTRREVTSLFAPVLSPDVRFTYFVLRNYLTVKTVKELAEKAHLSLSSFDKEFRQVFGMPPYRWMKERRSARLLHEITHSMKSLKEISEDCGFTSASQMNDYCKKEFGVPPGQLREQYYNRGGMQ